MALFGRRRGRGAQDEDAPVAEDDLDYDDHVEGSLVSELGPYDVEDAPEDDHSRLNLGSVLLPVADGAQIQVEMDPAGPIKAVHVLTPYGQITVNAYAAPRTGGLWEEVCGELADQLRGDGAAVHSEAGDWGQELVATLGDVALRFIGVDGPRWMLRGVVAGPPSAARQGSAVLREMLRDTVVIRGQGPMPVSTPLPIRLPDEMAAHFAQLQEQQQRQQQG